MQDRWVQLSRFSEFEAKLSIEDRHKLAQCEDAPIASNVPVVASTQILSSPSTQALLGDLWFRLLGFLGVMMFKASGLHTLRVLDCQVAMCMTTCSAKSKPS